MKRRFYLICTTHRTGSTLLAENFRRTNVAGDPREFLSPAKVPKIVASGCTDPEISCTKYIEDLKRISSTPNGVFGGKLMWRHLKLLRLYLQKDPFWKRRINPENPWEPIKFFFPKASAIWLRRNDKLRQAISLVRAKQTKIFELTGADADGATSATPQYDFNQIYDNLQTLTVRDEAWGALFKKVGVKPIMLEYEDLCRNPKQIASDLIRQMGIRDEQMWLEEKAPLRKQADNLNEEWYERYRAEEPTLAPLRAEQLALAEQLAMAEKLAAAAKIPKPKTRAAKLKEKFYGLLGKG